MIVTHVVVAFVYFSSEQFIKIVNSSGGNMEDRKNEICFALDMIQKLCETCEIGLIAKEVKGTLMIVVQDARDGQEYYISKKHE